MNFQESKGCPGHNAFILFLFQEVVESATVRDVLNRQFTLSKDVRGLLMLLVSFVFLCAFRKSHFTVILRSTCLQMDIIAIP